MPAQQHVDMTEKHVLALLDWMSLPLIPVDAFLPHTDPALQPANVAIGSREVVVNPSD